MSTRDAASPATSLPPLSAPKSLTDEVVSVLRSHILSGHFQSGDQLVQAELARSLGVSRGPVREALNQLKAEGLVFDEPRRGTFVRRPAPKTSATRWIFGWLWRCAPLTWSSSGGIRLRCRRSSAHSML